MTEIYLHMVGIVGCSATHALRPRRRHILVPLAKSLPGSPVNCSDHSRRDMATAGICANQDSCSAAPIAASSFSPSAAITLARSWRAVSGLGRLAYPNWGNNLLSLPNVVSCSGAPNGPLNLWDMLRFFADV